MDEINGGAKYSTKKLTAQEKQQMALTQLKRLGHTQDVVKTTVRSRAAPTRLNVASRLDAKSKDALSAQRGKIMGIYNAIVAELKIKLPTDMQRREIMNKALGDLGVTATAEMQPTFTPMEIATTLRNRIIEHEQNKVGDELARLFGNVNVRDMPSFLKFKRKTKTVWTPAVSTHDTKKAEASKKSRRERAQNKAFREMMEGMVNLSTTEHKAGPSHRAPMAPIPEHEKMEGGKKKSKEGKKPMPAKKA